MLTMKLDVMNARLLLIGLTFTFATTTVSIAQDGKKSQPKKEPVKLKQVKVEKSQLKQVKKVPAPTKSSVKK